MNAFKIRTQIDWRRLRRARTIKDVQEALGGVEVSVCVMCQMNLLEDHEIIDGLSCPECGRFLVDRDTLAQPCYHCSCSGQEDCPVCAPEIPAVFFDDAMTEELDRVLRARKAAQSSPNVN